MESLTEEKRERVRVSVKWVKRTNLWQVTGSLWQCIFCEKQRKCTVLPLGSPSLKSFMKPQTPTVTGRAITSSGRVTVGCVTQGRRTICWLIKLGEYWIRLVYLYPSCCECDFIFFNTFTTVLITPSFFFFFSATAPTSWYRGVQLPWKNFHKD